MKESGAFFLFQCAFSNGGHLFAAVHGNIIQIYSSASFENVSNLKGHNGKVCHQCVKKEYGYRSTELDSKMPF